MSYVKISIVVCIKNAYILPKIHFSQCYNKYLINTNKTNTENGQFFTNFSLSSAIAVNLKACNHFRLYNGKAAEVTMFSNVIFYGVV